MSRLSFDTKDPEEVITAAQANRLFVSLKDASDGTAGDIDATNLRDGAFTSKHLDPGVVHVNIGTLDSGAVTAGTTRASGVGGAATAWITIGDCTLSAPVLAQEGDVLRWHFNPLVGDGVTSGGNAYKAQQVYYWRVSLLYNTGGGTIALVIQQPLGYGMAQRSGNDAISTGSEGDIVAAWCRNAIAGIWINRGNVGWNIEGVRLEFRWAINDNAAAENRIDTCHVHGACVMEQM